MTDFRPGGFHRFGASLRSQCRSRGVWVPRSFSPLPAPSERYRQRLHWINRSLIVLCAPVLAATQNRAYIIIVLPELVNPQPLLGYLKSDVGFFCFRVFEKGGCSKVLCGVFSFRAVRGKAVAVKFYVGFPIRSDLCRKRHRHLTEDADAFLLECSGNQLNNSSSFCWSVPSLAYGSASNCRKLCLMSFVSSLKPRMYESAM